MQLNVEVEQEEDGRWLAEVALVPGALAYGATLAEAVARAEAVALWAMADRQEREESAGRPTGI